MCDELSSVKQYKLRAQIAELSGQFNSFDDLYWTVPWHSCSAANGPSWKVFCALSRTEFAMTEDDAGSFVSMAGGQIAIQTMLSVW